MSEVDFVGGDDNSGEGECSAVWRDRAGGGFYFRGKTVTDPAVLGEHVVKGDDESDIWLPASMELVIREALEGYEQGRQGPGEPHVRVPGRAHQAIGDPAGDAR